MTDIGEVPVQDFVKEWAGSAGKPYLGKPSGPSSDGNHGRRTGKPAGNFGGNKDERALAIKNKYPELG